MTPRSEPPRLAAPARAAERRWPRRWFLARRSRPGNIGRVAPFWRCRRRFFGRRLMRVSEAMSPNVQLAYPEDRISDVARTMGQFDAGIMPVGENDRLVGMITDHRPSPVRAVGHDQGPRDPGLRDVMTREVQYCFDDEDVSEVCGRRADQQLRRGPVVKRETRLVGILSLGDLAPERRSQPRRPSPGEHLPPWRPALAELLDVNRSNRPRFQAPSPAGSRTSAKLPGRACRTVRPDTCGHRPQHIR